MDWWFRFMFSLPCRREDARAVKSILSEALDPDWKLDRDLIYPYLLWGPYYSDWHEVITGLRSCYLVRDGNNQMKGIFGPSVNGLSSNAVILMSEIEYQRGLERLMKWL